MKKNKTYLFIGLPVVSIVITLFLYGYSDGFSKLNSSKKSTIVKKPITHEDTSLTFFFGGDIMGHMPMISAAKVKDEDRYEFNQWFQYIKPYIQKYDYAFANLEVTLGGSPYSGYPQFCSPDSYAEAAKNAGFDFLITANNHSQDKGKKGLERTLDVLDQLNIEHTGTFKDGAEREKKYPFIKVIHGKKIAVLNYTYGTNGLNVVAPNIVNLIDTIQMKIDLNKAKKLTADFIIVTLHWGAEYQRKNNKMQTDLAQWLCDQGTDAIIGMHPHVVQPMEIMHPRNDKTKNVPVAYSLGNFVSNQREQYKDGGIAVGMNLKIENGKVTFKDWSYLPFWVQLGGSPHGYYIVPVSDWEKNLEKYKFSDSESQKIKTFANDTRTLLKGIPEMK